MSLLTIQNALHNHLFSLDLSTIDNDLIDNRGRSKIFIENRTHEPKGNQLPYLEVFILPSTTFAAALGVSAKNRESGILQIDIAYSKNTGWKTCKNTVEGIRDHFKRGTTITKDTTVVRIFKASPERDIGVDEYRIPISIVYEADTIN